MIRNNGHWYAAMRDLEDEWGNGSYDFDEALEMAREYYQDGYSDALVAEIDEGIYGIDAECVREIYIKDEEE